MSQPGHNTQPTTRMTEKATEITYVEYKIPAKELRKIAETSIYTNLDCKFYCF